MEPVILSAVRTPVGKIRGSLSSTRPDDLLAQVLQEAFKRSKASREDLNECIAGCANQAGEDNRNIARMSLLLAGFSQSIPAVTVNRLCASGLEAVSQAARLIRTGEGELVLAGGVESMSRAPYAIERPAAKAVIPAKAGIQNKTGVTGLDASLRWHDKWGPEAPAIFDTSLGWRFPNPKMAKLFPLESMGQTAENIVERYGISRKDQDEFAFQSHQKALEAQKLGYFDAELLKLPELDRDEGPRIDTSIEKLAALKAVFKSGGTVTAGNSSGLNDGAAALLVASADYAKHNSLKPMARILGVQAAGVDPRFMGLGPVPATQKLLRRLGMGIEDIDLVELNEAFAAQALAVILGLNLKPERVNISGGAIALGHPLGASGARILTTLTHNLIRSKKKIGLATLCVGVGQGLSMIIENNMLS